MSTQIFVKIENQKQNIISNGREKNKFECNNINGRFRRHFILLRFDFDKNL